MMLSMIFYAGLQALLLTGYHKDVAGTQHGIAGGAILQFGARGKRVALHVEGIPPVSLPQGPSAYYGAAVPQLSLINGAFRFAVDPAARWWLGAGETIINQRTPLPNLSQVVSSRLAGVRAEIDFRQPLRAGTFFEASAGGAPHLTGADRYVYSTGQPEVDKPEVAAEEDGMLGFGVTRSGNEFLGGLRIIGFSARYALTGAAADRNYGGGLFVEWRKLIP
jgi:hypothetical protein